MLILPIISNKRVLNVEVKIKDIHKIKTRVSYKGTKEREIIVNRVKFSDSMFSKTRDINAPVDFIRSKSILYPRKFLVTTREENNTSLYDVYEVPKPPEKVNDNLDKLYSKAITDMRSEIPNMKKRGRYISLEDLGIGEHLSDDRIMLLQRVMREPGDNLGDKLKKAGISDLAMTADFLNNFECTVISDSDVSEDSVQETLNAMSIINTRDYRHLKKYYQMAKSNTDIYAKISYINKLLYNKPLTLLCSNDNYKCLVKKKDDYEYKNAA